MNAMRWLSSTSSIIAVTVSMVLVGGCSAGSGTGEEPAPTPGGTSTSSAPSQSPTPVAMSIEEYSSTLAKTIGPLASALDGLAAAKGYKGLEKRVASVESVANKAATGLEGVVPPAEVASENAELVTALQGFGEELGGLSSDVGDRSLCTGSTVRASLGNEKATPTLRSAMAAVSGKLPGREPTLKLPAADQKGDGRPENGDFIRSGDRDGRGELTIKNGGSNDALVSLAKKGKPQISVYVRKGQTTKVRGVPDNTYALYFSGGGAWDGDARAFGRNCGFQKFAEQLKFRTNRTAAGITWQTYTITLNPVFGGNAQTQDVNPDEFPDS